MLNTPHNGDTTCGGEWLDSRHGLCTPGEIAPGTHSMGPRAGLDTVEHRNFSCICPGRPARSPL
jgi:hypothetical protein